LLFFKKNQKEISDIEKEMAQLSKDTNAELHELTMVLSFLSENQFIH